MSYLIHFKKSVFFDSLAIYPKSQITPKKRLPLPPPSPPKGGWEPTHARRDVSPPKCLLRYPPGPCGGLFMKLKKFREPSYNTNRACVRIRGYSFLLQNLNIWLTPP